jgi:hypothetical protein
MKIYLYNNWHNGDILTNRCLIKALMNYDIDIAVGSYMNRHYLVGDLPVSHIVAEWDEDTPRSPCLSALCPNDRICLNTWCGTFPDIDRQHYHNWATIVKTWNRYSETYNFGITLSYKEVPMVDFEYPCSIKTRGRAIFVENGPVRSGHCPYHFDMNDLGNRYPDFNFYCSYSPDTQLPNVIDCGSRNLVHLSFISNGCEAILGKGSGPFICTYTEANRKKPRAVVGYNSVPFWDYRNNPLKYLKDTQELYDFLDDVKNQPWEVI